MASGLSMLNPQKTGLTHTEAFLERYERLRGLTLQLTERKLPVTLLTLAPQLMAG
jgi:hypothetical protein